MRLTSIFTGQTHHQIDPGEKKLFWWKLSLGKHTKYREKAILSYMTLHAYSSSLKIVIADLLARFLLRDTFLSEKWVYANSGITTQVEDQRYTLIRQSQSQKYS